MQTLGLSSKPQPTDSIFKRLLWPSIENQYDVDLLGQQGFYVLLGITALSLIMTTILAGPLLGIYTGLVYFLAACGVRERSVAAAMLATTLYASNFVGSFLVGSPGNPLLQVVVLMLLLANVRATLLSRRWLTKPAGSEDFVPEDRSVASFMDRVANRLPTRVWPVGRYIFYPLAVLLLLLTFLGLVAMKRAATRKDQFQTTQGIAPANQ